MGMVCESKVVSSMPETSKYEWLNSPFLIFRKSLGIEHMWIFAQHVEPESTAMKHCYVRWCYPALRPPRFSRQQDPSAGIRPWNRKEPPQNEIHAEMSIIGRSVAFRNGPFFHVNCHSLPGLSGACHMLTMLTVTVKHCGVGLFLRHGLTLGTRGCAREGIPVRASWFYVASRAQRSFSSIPEIYLKPMERPLKKRYLQENPKIPIC